MQLIENKTQKIFSLTIFFLGIVGLVSVMALDKFYWKTGIFFNDLPNLYNGYIFRSILILISVLFMIWSIIGMRELKLVLVENDGLLIEQLFILGSFFFSFIFLFLFFFKTSFFNDLASEDSLLEWGSFYLQFFSSVTFIISFITFKKKIIYSKITRWILLLFALVFFIIAMEEVSWFQRVLEFETPKGFEENSQGEFNFHNFATSRIENIYYFFSLIFLVAWPFLRSIFHTFLNIDFFKIFVPRPFVIIIGAFASAYNYDMWNIIFTQITFWLAVVILLAYVLFSINWKDRIIALSTLLLTIITQICFLTNGENFYRIYKVKEFKEFLIPLAFFAFSIDVYLYIRRDQTTKKS